MRITLIHTILLFLFVCVSLRPEVAIAPLSTMVGEWSLATTDCAKWLNGYNAGSRFDGTFLPGVPALGTCVGQNDITNKTIWTPEYKNFLQHYTQKQMDAYESGSSQGWFFWSVAHCTCSTRTHSAASHCSR